VVKICSLCRVSPSPSLGVSGVSLALHLRGTVHCVLHCCPRPRGTGTHAATQRSRHGSHHRWTAWRGRGRRLDASGRGDTHCPWHHGGDTHCSAAEKFGIDAMRCIPSNRGRSRANVKRRRRTVSGERCATGAAERWAASGAAAEVATAHCIITQPAWWPISAGLALASVGVLGAGGGAGGCCRAAAWCSRTYEINHFQRNWAAWWLQ